MFKVKRDYGNGFEVEVEAAKMTEVIEQLGVCDEIFMEVWCGAEIDGEKLMSTKVRFQHRKVGDDHYYEQVCMDPKVPKLKFFKRKLGQHKGSTIGSLFVHTKPDDDPNCTPGVQGWSKYNGTGQQGGGYASNAPQREQAPPPRREPERQPAASSVSYDDIPF